MTILADVVRSGTTRGLDFVLIDELRKRTGVSPSQILKFALSEMICNALDKNDATAIGISVETVDNFQFLSASDDGTKKITKQDLELILDFENKASSKRGFLRVSRGYLGNALKCIIGYSFALADDKGLSPKPVVAESGGFRHEISLNPDRVREVIEHKIESSKVQDSGLTTLIVAFPKSEGDDPKALKDTIFAFHMVNPQRTFSFDIFGEKGILHSSNEKVRPIRNETSIRWYSEAQFTDLFRDYVRTTPDAMLKDFMALFRGFTSKAVMREKLEKLNAGDHDSKIVNFEFLPGS